jgi:hypothetical protein
LVVRDVSIHGYTKEGSIVTENLASEASQVVVGQPAAASAL